MAAAAAPGGLNDLGVVGREQGALLPFVAGLATRYTGYRRFTVLSQGGIPGPEASAGKLAGTAFFGGPQQTGPFHGLQAERARIPYANAGLVKLPIEVSDDQAILLSDIFPTAYFGAELAEFGRHRSLRHAQPQRHRDQALLGAVVQVTLDAAPRLISSSDDARPRGDQLGVGLSVAQRTELHGGTLNGPGRGSKFIVRSPAASPGLNREGAWRQRVPQPDRRAPSQRSHRRTARA